MSGLPLCSEGLVSGVRPLTEKDTWPGFYKPDSLQSTLTLPTCNNPTQKSQNKVKRSQQDSRGFGHKTTKYLYITSVVMWRPTKRNGRGIGNCCQLQRWWLTELILDSVNFVEEDEIFMEGGAALPDQQSSQPRVVLEATTTKTPILPINWSLAINWKINHTHYVLLQSFEKHSTPVTVLYYTIIIPSKRK